MPLSLRHFWPRALALRPVVMLCAALTCVGCSSVNPFAMARLAQLNPMTTDPADFAARLHLPDGLQIPPDGATLVVQAERSDIGAQREARYAFVSDGEIWTLSDRDAADLRAVQTMVQAWKAEAPDATTGSITLQLTGCAVGAGPAPNAPVSADLSLDGGRSFVPLIKGLTAADVTRAHRTTGALAQAPCPTG